METSDHTYNYTRDTTLQTTIMSSTTNIALQTTVISSTTDTALQTTAISPTSSATATNSSTISSTITSPQQCNNTHQVLLDNGTCISKSEAQV